MVRAYQICTRCVMDTTDPEITFDDQGVCNHCHDFEQVTKPNWFPNEEGNQKLQQIFQKIKTFGQGRSYDCILGLSGGVDSSYLALKVHEWGLRPLVVHVDAGWNSELAVANIEAIVKYCNYDLYTHVIDWEEMRDLQLAYLKSAISNQDVPQDHAFFANMYHFAVQNDIRYVLSGGNIATEAIFPKAWHGSAMDSINLRSIHQRFGQIPLKNYHTISFFDYYLGYPFIKKMQVVRPLNYLPYHKGKAIVELQEKIGWRAYGRKHGESLFTKFFQNYYLPVKFGYDKRRPHLSSLIVSGQMSRSDALSKLEEPLYHPDELETDITFFCKKLRISRDDFNQLMMLPNRHYTDFNNWDLYQKIIKNIQKFVEKSTGKKSGAYS